MTNHFRSTLTILGFGFGAFITEALYSGNEKFYRDVVIPTCHVLIPDGDRAHTFAVQSVRFGIVPRKPMNQFPDLHREVFGLQFDHPIGMAAGFDKNGESAVNLLKAGFSYVEVGSVTPQPQIGNPIPRIFRWRARDAVINRCGFNSDGHDAVYDRLKGRPWEGHGIVGVNLGCNKSSLDPIEDFVLGVKKFGNVADYLVINVSSPNTPGLRSLQAEKNLSALLTRVLKARETLNKRTPILIKISPDESDERLIGIVQAAMHPSTRVDGMIVSNTTLASEAEAHACGAAPFPPGIAQSSSSNVWGGLSGRPLMDKSTTCLAKVSSLTNKQLPLIGVGGISDPEDVVEKLEAGASLVQLYTSFIYQGPPVAHRLARGLHQRSLTRLSASVI